MFGEQRRVRPGESFNLGFDVQSVDGLRSVQLIGAGVVLVEKSFAGAQKTHVDFPLSTQHSTWYALIVEDIRGRKAYTDPIWIDAVAINGPEGYSSRGRQN
jgi:hypothetical protein